MPREELRSELDLLADKLADKFQLDCRWSSDDCLDFSRSGAQGQVNITDDEVALTVRLGMLLSAFSGTIEQEVHDFLEEHIY